MSDQDNMPIHEQAYRIVVEGQEAEKQRWLFGRALRALGRALGFVLVILPMRAIPAARGSRSGEHN